MNTLEKYRVLDSLGIRPWLARQGLCSHRPIIGARCLVILPEDPSQLSAPETKIFQGMLSVLALPEDALCIAWAWEGRSLNHWLPQSVLLLGIETTLEVSGIIKSTHHPKTLSQNPQYKEEAYQDLLWLKGKIATCAE